MSKPVLYAGHALALMKPRSVDTAAGHGFRKKFTRLINTLSQLGETESERRSGAIAELIGPSIACLNGTVVVYTKTVPELACLLCKSYSQAPSHGFLKPDGGNSPCFSVPTLQSQKPVKPT
jgi:hypothetical protein